jgi:hypothetical protein
MGEFARPYLVSQEKGIRLSSSLATILIERIYDFSSLIVIMLVVLFFVTLPPWVFTSGLIIIAVILPLIVLLTVMTIKRESSMRIIDIVVSRLPSAISHRVRRIIPAFMDGLEILPDLKRSLLVALTSILLWGFSGLSVYVLFFSFGFHLPIIAAYAVLVMIALGLVLPTAPGFVGNFHFFCAMGLVLFGIPKTEALTFAILLHFTQIVPVIICGFLFLPFHKVSLPSLFKSQKDI